MRTTRPIATVSFALAILAFSCPAPAASRVYKCVVDGKTRYSATPPANGGQCQETPIRDDGPSPEEWARLQEEKQRRQEEEQQAKETELKEREIQAKELEAEAEARRARAEEQLLLQQQAAPTLTSPYYGYPYWGGGGIVQPFPYPPHRAFVKPPPQALPHPPRYLGPSPGYLTPLPGQLTPLPNQLTPLPSQLTPLPGHPTPAPGFPAH